MSPEIAIIDPLHPEKKLLRQAWTQLQAGELVIFPTETVYGLAADPDNPLAMEKLYQVKGRDENKPIAQFVAHPSQIPRESLSNPAWTRTLSESFWPGPLTLVLRFAQDWVGFRIPDHTVPLELMRLWGRPLAVTSANRSGQPAASRVDARLLDLGHRVSLVLDGGPCPGGVASTVVRIGEDDWEILREGAITRTEIEKALSA